MAKRKPCRYRYANGSPKRRKFEGAHQWAKECPGARPTRFPPLEEGVYMKWEFQDGAMSAVGSKQHFPGQGQTPQGLRWFHATCMVAKQRRRQEKRGSARVPHQQ